ncbi:hypothetical protein TPHV1_160002 [Treponema phagedenis]|uniref:Uncharacterized protein n=1 Tax=Treponema phagedenis TaxID=162 RepID=A0A0B7GX20_TREPH|nr:hypothetical protein TPHV1_160002 [Treponema phagedenis]
MVSLLTLAPCRALFITGSFKTRSTDLIKNTKNQCVAVVPRR